MNTQDAVLRLAAPFVRSVYGGAGLILMYHRVIPTDSKPRIPGHSIIEVTPAQLEASILYFARHKYTPVSPDGLYQRLCGGMTLPGRFVLFTFDDGYLDNYTYAYPVLKKYEVPFTVNVTTGFPDRTVAIWWYLLEELVLSRDRISFSYAGQVYEFLCTSAEEKARAFAQMRRMLKYANTQAYFQLIKAIFEGIDIYRLTDELALSWDQIQEMAGDPLVTILAHTMNHHVLTSLTEEEVRQEIGGSKHLLEQRLGSAVDHFAYPFGYRNEAGEREFRIAAEYGFKTAMTTRYGNIFAAHKDHLMALPRYDISRTPRLDQLDSITSGALSMRMNKFKRVITS